ncbi:MAG: helix-hairpin-helix domain-containing protein [Prevotellaceae bacterium]|nr:helix-hairpin-helix domain-containing protein [Prevotellaceae bacterium]
MGSSFLYTYIIMHHLFREFLLLSRGERHGVLALIVLLIVILSMSFGYHLARRGTPTPADTTALQARQAFMAALTATPQRTTPTVTTRPQRTAAVSSPSPRAERTPQATPSVVRRADTLSAPRPTKTLRPFKYATVTPIDLNRADTTELKKIPGIGSVLSRRIVNYRNRLGGYCSAQQLFEIGLDTVQLDAWFTLSTADIRRIHINTANVGQLMSHPYINFYQAKAIVDCRKQNGPLRSLALLAVYEEFPPDKLERLKPYVTFE